MIPFYDGPLYGATFLSLIEFPLWRTLWKSNNADYLTVCLMRLVHHISLLYVRVNSIILYKLRYYNIYLLYLTIQNPNFSELQLE